MPLAVRCSLCYSLPPAEKQRVSEEASRVSQTRQEAKKEVDEYRETLHNLISLLLTNKTLRKAQQAVPNSSLKINSR